MICGFVGAGHSAADLPKDGPRVRNVTGKCDAGALWVTVESLVNESRPASAAILLHYSGYGFERNGCPRWLADALRNPAPHLSINQHRLQHPAAIIDTSIGGKRRAPGGWVELDLGDVDAVGEGWRGVKRAFRIEAVAELLGAVRQLEERDLPVGAGDLEHTAAILDVRFRGFEDMRSEALSFFDDRVERPGNRAADRHRRARGDGCRRCVPVRPRPPVSRPRRRGA